MHLSVFVRPTWWYYLLTNGRQREVEDPGRCGPGGTCPPSSGEVFHVRLGPFCNRPYRGVWYPVSPGRQKAFLVRRTPHISYFKSSSIFPSLESAASRRRWDAPLLLRTGSAGEETPGRPSRHTPFAFYFWVPYKSAWGLLVCAQKAATLCRSGGCASDNAVSISRVRPGGAALLFAGRFPRDIRCLLAEGRREPVHDATVRS